MVAWNVHNGFRIRSVKIETPVYKYEPICCVPAPVGYAIVRARVSSQLRCYRVVYNNIFDSRRGVRITPVVSKTYTGREFIKRTRVVAAVK